VDFVGIDLAWGMRARTGVAVADDSGALVASGSVRSDADLDAWLSARAPAPLVVAVDAPLVVPNATGMRDGERALGRAFARYQAGCHVSNRSRPWFDPPRGAVLADRHGWSLDPVAVPSPGRPVCLEVYPHAATVGLFRLGRTLKYKRGPVLARRGALIDLLARMTTLAPLALSDSARWREIEDAVAAATRPMHLDAVEDEVDAIVCAHLAWLWTHDRTAPQVYGDPALGAIVAPPPPTHRPG